MRAAKAEAGISKKQVSVHTLRHYPEFRNMPSKIGGPRTDVELRSIAKALLSAYSMTSERLEKGEQLVIGSIATDPTGLRFNFI
jgi:ASC-1-like (ASCH) protein